MALDTSMKLLLVEDSAATRKMELMILKKLGFHDVLEAEDGESAIEVLRENPDVGLIISDWNMPGMDGLALLKWVRAEPDFALVPFIMATGRGEKKEAAIASEAGVSSIVPKPFTAPDLQQKLEDIFVHGKTMDTDEETAVRQPDMRGNRIVFHVAHIQITDHLVLGVAKHLIKIGEFTPNFFDLETHCMPGWNPVAEQLENAEIDGAFVLAPIAMDLFGYGTPIKLILLAHKNGSIMVRKKSAADVNDKEAFRNKTFYIPHRLSVHHMLSHMYLSELGLKPGEAGMEGVDVNFEVVPPVKMPEFLANNEEAAGFMVAEPLGTKAIASNSANLQFLSAEAWEDHPCCVVTFRDEIIQQHPQAVQEFTHLLVRAGKYIKKYPEKSAQVAVEFLDPDGSLKLSANVLKNVLTETKGITTDDLYPVVTELDAMQGYMSENMGVGSRFDINEFVDTTFAEEACIDSARDKFASSKLQTGDLAKRVSAARSQVDLGKLMLDKEGKYLLFSVAEEDYGLGIMKMREIVGLSDLTKMPKTPEYVRGVIKVREQLIPVLDLQSWFGYGLTEFHNRTAVIIVETGDRTSSGLLGLVVDSVDEIVDISADNVEQAPSMGFGDDVKYILAMAKIKEQVKVLLDIDSIVNQTTTAIAV
jgi:chemotaxis signal transduction protein/ABC-type nitrate/sulfonate/bicarbonate transport system substrate-binding protein